MLHYTNDRDLRTQLDEKEKELKELRQMKSNLPHETESMRIVIETGKEKLSKIKTDWAQRHKNLKSKLSELEEEFRQSFNEFEKNWQYWTTEHMIDWLKCLENHE